MTNVAKIIEIVGSSNTDWQDAAQAALNEAKKDNTWYNWSRSWRYDRKSRSK